MRFLLPKLDFVNRSSIFKVEDPDLQGENGTPDPELEEMTSALRKILYAPLFREDVHDFKKRLVKRRSDHDDLIAAFVDGLKKIQEHRFGLRVKRQAPQLDENILSALVNNPEALQLVLDYLEKNEDKAKKAEEKKNAASKPQRHSPPKRAQRRPFSANTNRAPERRRNDNYRPPAAPQQQLPFRVQQLNRQQQQLNRQQQQLKLQEQEEKRKQDLIRQRLEHEKRLKPLVNNEERADNPLLNGNFGTADLQFFGPSDYKPDRPYALPGVEQKENGDKVYPWQVGYIPIPR